LPRANFVEACPIVDEVMLIKEKEEIQLLRQVAAIADAGFLAAFKILKPGITENMLVGEAERAMRRLGSEWSPGPGNADIGSGYRTAFNERGFTQPPTNKIIQRGENVLIDLGPVYRLYMGDACYNAIVGKPSKEQESLKNAYEHISKYLIQNMKAGIKISDFVKLAYKEVVATGYDKYSVPYFGHGAGTDVRIPPIIDLNNETCFKENMVVTAGLHFYAPHIGGMRLEAPVLITKNGGEILTKYNLEVHEAPIF